MAQTARVTFLTNPDFKNWLADEARKIGVSVSEFIRLRCQDKPNDEDILLLEMASELKKATQKANAALNKGLCDAETLLNELRKRKIKK